MRERERESERKNLSAPEQTLINTLETTVIVTVCMFVYECSDSRLWTLIFIRAIEKEFRLVCSGVVWIQTLNVQALCLIRSELQSAATAANTTHIAVLLY